MNSSPEVGKVMAALQKAIGSLPNPHNDSDNPHFKSRFVSLPGALDWVKVRLYKEGVRISQPAVTREGMVGCVTRFTHESGEWVEEGELLFPYKGEDPQKAASALTYARRYSLLAACGIASTDDDDDGNFAASPPPKPAPPNRATITGPTTEQIDKADSLYERLGQAGDGEDRDACKRIVDEANGAVANGLITPKQHAKIGELAAGFKKRYGW